MKKLLALLILLTAGQMRAAVLDDFPSDNMNWLSAGGGAAPHVNTGGGPLGGADNYISNVSDGTAGSGGKQVLHNSVQWAIDFTAAGVTEIQFYARTSYSTPLPIRIAIDGVGGKFGSTNAVNLPNDGAWHLLTIGVTTSDFTYLSGGTNNLASTLAGVTMFRLLANSVVNFGGLQIASTVDYDAITYITSSTSTPTNTYTATNTFTASNTPTPTMTATPTNTATPTLTWTPNPAPKYVYVADENRAFIYKLNSSGVQVGQIVVTIANNRVEGLFGLTRKPNGEYYAIVNLDNYPEEERALARINMVTGQAQFLGWMGTFVTTLESDESGNLWTVTGGSSIGNEDFYHHLARVDAGGGVTPLYAADSNGPHALGMNYDDHRLYHLSGNNADRLAFHYMPVPAGTNIIRDLDNTPGKADALAYFGNGMFLASMDDEIYWMGVNGSIGSEFWGGTDQSGRLKGVVVSTDNFNWSMVLSLPAGQYLYTIQPWTNGATFRKVDAATGMTMNQMDLTLSVGSINRVNSMARHPLTGVIYVAGSDTGSYPDATRFLATLDPSTGVLTILGGTGHAISSMAFNATGTLYAAVGSNGANSHDLVTLDLATGAATQVVAAGSAPGGWTNGNKALGYNSADDALYLTTGNYQNYFRIFASPTPGITSVTTYGPNVGYAYSMAPMEYRWFFTMFDDQLGGISQDGEFRVGPHLDHYNKGMFVAGDLAMFTPTVTPTATDTPTPQPTYAWPAGQVVYLADKDDPKIREFNPITGIYIKSVDAYLPGDDVYGLFGLAKDPSNGDFYVAFESNNLSNRGIAKINMTNGLMTLIGDTGDYITGIAFDAAGNLYGSTGNSGSGDLLTINKSTAVVASLASSFGGTDGVSLLFRPADSLLYRLQGKPTFNNLDSITTGGTVVSVNSGVSLNNFQEVRAAAILPDGNMLVYDGDDFRALDATGADLGYVAFNGNYTNKGMWVSAPIANFGALPLPGPIAYPTVVAQTLLGASRGSNNIDEMNESGTLIASHPVSGVTGIFYGLAFNAFDSTLYAIADTISGSRRYVSIDTSTWTATDLGYSGDNVSGIAFNPATGALYGVGGSSSSDPGDIYTMNPATGAITGVLLALANDCGTSIAWDTASNHLFRGQGCNFNELTDIDVGGPSSVNVTLSNNSVDDSITSLTSWAPGFMLLGHRSGKLYRITTGGSVTLLGDTNDGYKGLAAVPNSSLATPLTPLPTPSGKSLIAAVAYGSSLRKLDPTTGAFVADYPLVVPGEVISTQHGLAKDPITGLLYVLVRYDSSSSSDRTLLTFDPATGATAVIGMTTNYFNGLAFDTAGQLYASVGSGGTDSGGVYTVNKADATSVLLTSSNTGSNGLSLAYNPLDSLLYRIEGYGSTDLTTIDPVGPTVATVTVSGYAPQDYPQGLTYYQSGNFLASYGLKLYLITSTGVYTQIGTVSMHIKGLAIADVATLPTPTSTPQRTATPQMTSTPTQTPGFGRSGADISILGPVPAKKDQPICLYFPAKPESSKWTVYNTAGEKVAEVSFGSESSQCWQHKDMAPGLYLARLEVVTSKGKEARTQKIVILP